MLSSTNFTWSIQGYFVPFMEKKLHHIENLVMDYNRLDNNI